MAATTGYLTRAISRIRLLFDEPTVLKFSDDALIDMIRAGFSEVMREVNAVNTAKVHVRYDVAVTADVEDYELPPYIGEFLKFEKVDTNGRTEWEVIPQHHLNPYGPGYQIMGPILRISPAWKVGYTMRITYTPNGEMLPHEGTATSNAAGTTLTLGVSVTKGTLDTRPNAYAGYIVRLLDPTYAAPYGSDDFIQERPITAYNRLTKVATVSPAFSPIPTTTGGAQVYEVVPNEYLLFENVVIDWVVRRLAQATGDERREGQANRAFHSGLRALRLGRSRVEARRGMAFERASRIGR